MTEYNIQTEAGRAAVRRGASHRLKGKKIPCPYCDGKGHNAINNCECGFCTNGIHTIGT